MSLFPIDIITPVYLNHNLLCDLVCLCTIILQLSSDCNWLVISRDQSSNYVFRTNQVVLPSCQMIKSCICYIICSNDVSA